VSDRIDGRPAQEATWTIEEKRSATDWTRAELVAFLERSLAGKRPTRPKWSEIRRAIDQLENKPSEVA
jgi:hypothetical protein